MKLKEILFGIGIIGGLAGIVMGCIIHNKKVADEMLVDVKDNTDTDGDLKSLIDLRSMHQEETRQITSENIDIPESAINAVREMQESMRSTFKDMEDTDDEI